MAAYTTTMGGTTAALEYEKGLVAADTLVITATPAVSAIKVKSNGGVIYGRRGSAPSSSARVKAIDGGMLSFSRPKGTLGLWTVYITCSTNTTINASAEGEGAVSDGAVGSDTADGSITTAKLADDAVTFVKMQNIATDSLIGRDTTGSGDPENITLNATLSMDGSGALQRAALTGDVTASAGSNTTTVVKVAGVTPGAGGLAVLDDENVAAVRATISAARTWVKTAAPTTGDDSADGYAAGDFWNDTVNLRTYVADSVAVGNASWRLLLVRQDIVTEDQRGSVFRLDTQSTPAIAVADSGTLGGP